MADGPEFTVRQALRTPVFWLLTAAQVASSVAIVSISLHLSPKLTDMGMSLTGAGVVTSVMVMAALPSQFVAGFLADRLPKPPLIAFLMFLQSSGDSSARAERERDRLFALRVRHRLRHRFRRAHAAHHGDTGRVLRAAVVRHHNGRFTATDEHRHDLRAAVRGLHVRHHGHVPGALQRVRGAELFGRGTDAVRQAPGAAGAFPHSGGRLGGARGTSRPALARRLMTSQSGDSENVRA